MLSISFSCLAGNRIVYTLVGDITTIHLVRLEQIINSSIAKGMGVCFDMSAVMTLDGGAVHFFTEGPGTLAALAGPPPPLDEFRSSNDTGPQERKSD